MKELTEQQKQSHELLRLIQAELIKRRLSVVIRPKLVDPYNLKEGDQTWSAGGTETALEVGGIAVPLTIQKRFAAKHAPVESTSRLIVRIAGIDDVSNPKRTTNLIPVKNFTWSKKRSDTYGFSPSDIANYVVTWLEQRKIHSQKKHGRKQSLEHNRKSVEALTDKFVLPDGAAVEATRSGGIRLTFTTDAETAEAALTAAGFQRKAADE